jgi:GntR family transcriptional regulator, rspAB operon transcriptional repressor
MSYAALSSSTLPRRGVSKAVFVYEDLRAAIVSLALKPGARIDKTEICGRLHVSRQPLAEAIARLAEERLVDVEPQKGTFIARIRLSDVAEAAFVRRALETAMVGAIAPAIEDTALARLDRILGYQAAAVKAKDTEEFYALDVRFHTMLFDRLAMRRVAEVVETSRAQLERTRRLLLPTPGRNQNTLREHRAIFAALQLRDPVKAARAMGEHLDEVMAELKRFAAQQPDLFEP